MTRRERLYGWLAGKLIVRTGRLARARGDVHLWRHSVLALVYGNSDHSRARCRLPDDFDAFVADFHAEREEP